MTHGDRRQSHTGVRAPTHLSCRVCGVVRGGSQRDRENQCISSEAAWTDPVGLSGCPAAGLRWEAGCGQVAGSPRPQAPQRGQHHLENSVGQSPPAQCLGHGRGPALRKQWGTRVLRRDMGKSTGSEFESHPLSPGGD